MNVMLSRWLLTGFLGVMALAQAGCLAAAAAGACAGVGAYAYYQGNKTEEYGAEFAQVYQASKEALGDMAMPVITERHEGLTGTLESSLTDGTKVTIAIEEKPRMKSEDGHKTEVGVRVGMFGDEGQSSQLMKQISTRLGHQLRSGPATGSAAVRPGDRLPPLGQPAGGQQPPPGVQPAGGAQPGYQPTAVSAGATGWKPAGQSNGEAPKPP